MKEINLLESLVLRKWLICLRVLRFSVVNKWLEIKSLQSSRRTVTADACSIQSSLGLLEKICLVP